MKIIPHDLGTFLASSRSRRGENHIVDIVEATCSCEAFQFYGTCRHLKGVLDRHAKPKPRKPMTVRLIT